MLKMLDRIVFTLVWKEFMFVFYFNKRLRYPSGSCFADLPFSMKSNHRKGCSRECICYVRHTFAKDGHILETKREKKFNKHEFVFVFLDFISAFWIFSSLDFHTASEGKGKKAPRARRAATKKLAGGTLEFCVWNNRNVIWCFPSYIWSSPAPGA